MPALASGRNTSTAAADASAPAASQSQISPLTPAAGSNARPAAARRRRNRPARTRGSRWPASAAVPAAHSRRSGASGRPAPPRRCRRPAVLRAATGAGPSQGLRAESSIDWFWQTTQRSPLASARARASSAGSASISLASRAARAGADASASRSPTIAASRVIGRAPAAGRGARRRASAGRYA